MRRCSVESTAVIGDPGDPAMIELGIEQSTRQAEVQAMSLMKCGLLMVSNQLAPTTDLGFEQNTVKLRVLMKLQVRHQWLPLVQHMQLRAKKFSCQHFHLLFLALDLAKVGLAQLLVVQYAPKVNPRAIQFRSTRSLAQNTTHSNSLS